MSGVAVRRFQLETLEGRALPADLYSAVFAAMVDPDFGLYSPTMDAAPGARPRAAMFLPPPPMTVLFQPADVSFAVELPDARSDDPPASDVAINHSQPAVWPSLSFPVSAVITQPEPTERRVAASNPAPLIVPTVPSGPEAEKPPPSPPAPVIDWADDLTAPVDVDGWEQATSRFLDSLETAIQNPDTDIPESPWIRLGYWAVSVGAIVLAVELTRQGFRARRSIHAIPTLTVK